MSWDGDLIVGSLIFVDGGYRVPGNRFTRLSGEVPQPLFDRLQVLTNLK